MWCHSRAGTVMVCLTLYIWEQAPSLYHQLLHETWKGLAISSLFSASEVGEYQQTNNKTLLWLVLVLSVRCSKFFLCLNNNQFICLLHIFIANLCTSKYCPQICTVEHDEGGNKAPCLPLSLSAGQCRWSESQVCQSYHWNKTILL